MTNPIILLPVSLNPTAGTRKNTSNKSCAIIENANMKKLLKQERYGINCKQEAMKKELTSPLRQEKCSMNVIKKKKPERKRERESNHRDSGGGET